MNICCLPTKRTHVDRSGSCGHDPIHNVTMVDGVIGDTLSRHVGLLICARRDKLELLAYWDKLEHIIVKRRGVIEDGGWVGNAYVIGMRNDTSDILTQNADV